MISWIDCALIRIWLVRPRLNDQQFRALTNDIVKISCVFAYEGFCLSEWWFLDFVRICIRRVSCHSKWWFQDFARICILRVFALVNGGFKILPVFAYDEFPALKMTASRYRPYLHTTMVNDGSKVPLVSLRILSLHSDNWWLMDHTNGLLPWGIEFFRIPIW